MIEKMGIVDIGRKHATRMSIRSFPRSPPQSVLSRNEITDCDCRVICRLTVSITSKLIPKLDMYFLNHAGGGTTVGPVPRRRISVRWGGKDMDEWVCEY